MKTSQEILATAIAEFDNFGFDSAHDYLQDEISGLHDRRDALAHQIRDGKLAADRDPSMEARVSGREAAKAELAAFAERIELTRAALMAAKAVS